MKILKTFLIELRSKTFLNCTVVGHFFATHSVRSSSPSIRTNKRGEEEEKVEDVKTGGAQEIRT